MVLLCWCILTLTIEIVTIFIRLLLCRLLWLLLLWRLHLWLLLLYLAVEDEWRHYLQHHTSHPSGQREAVLEGRILTHTWRSCLGRPNSSEHGVVARIRNGNPRDEGVAVVGEHQLSHITTVEAECGGAFGHWCVGRLSEGAIQTAAANIPVEEYPCVIYLVSLLEVVEDLVLDQRRHRRIDGCARVRQPHAVVVVVDAVPHWRVML
mmetsp:Transcript_30479/g.88598  ORF Transcript_30479/g.88598 Transcript_30479/m.88598 type:complete len:207 (-) Transcript_30479:24-644(-)